MAKVTKILQFPGYHKRPAEVNWELVMPRDPPPAETAGLTQDEVHFIDKYLRLADEFLRTDTVIEFRKKTG